MNVRYGFSLVIVAEVRYFSELICGFVRDLLLPNEFVINTHSHCIRVQTTVSGGPIGKGLQSQRSSRVIILLIIHVIVTDSDTELLCHWG